MTDPVVRLSELTRTFQLGDTAVHALQAVSVSVDRGEFVAIMGSSGSGKSTMMNIVGCLDRPTSGQFFFEGRDVARLSEPELADIRSKRIGFVFQSFNLLARTSALENVVLPLLYGAAASLTSTERLDRGRAMLASVGLADRARNTPNQLSGGQQQRIALARALINHPAVLLADEPTGNLDSRTSHEIMEIIRRLNREQGVTVIVVTHEPDIARLRRPGHRDARRAHRLRRTSGGRRDPGSGRCRCRPDGRRARGPRRRSRRRDRRSRRVPVDDRVRVAAGPGAQQAPVGADDARCLHRSGRAHRDGGRRRRGQRRREEAARKPRDEYGRGSAGRHDHRWRPRWRRQRLDADRGRRRRDPARGPCRRAGELPHSPGRPGRVRRPELEHRDSGCDAQLPGHRQLAHRARRRDDRAAERRGRNGLPDRHDGLSEPVSGGRGSRRRDHPDQRRPDEGHRTPRRQGTDGLRTGPGRRGA